MFGCCCCPLHKFEFLISGCLFFLPYSLSVYSIQARVLTLVCSLYLCTAASSSNNNNLATFKWSGNGCVCIFDSFFSPLLYCSSMCVSLIRAIYFVHHNHIDEHSHCMCNVNGAMLLFMLHIKYIIDVASAKTHTYSMYAWLTVTLATNADAARCIIAFSATTCVVCRICVYC